MRSILKMLPIVLLSGVLALPGAALAQVDAPAATTADRDDGGDAWGWLGLFGLLGLLGLRRRNTPEVAVRRPTTP